jgi:iron complex outermembrane receptor protein
MGDFSRGAYRHLLAGSAAIMCMAVATPATAQTRSFNVPAQDASRAIPQFAKQAGVQILANARDVRGKKTRKVSGSYSVQEGLRLLLAGTGLEVAPDSGTGIITVRARSVTAADQAGAGSELAGDMTSDRSGAEDADIVVTGSRLAASISSAPITRVDRREIESSGYTTTGDILKIIPENFGGGQNQGVFSARGSSNSTSVSQASSPNLRGLGSDSTLTLIDGHRLAYDGYQNAVDISAIPLAAIERIEVLRDGASAIYGADAVGGVVNVITRNDLTNGALTLSASAPTRGGTNTSQISLVQGFNIGGGNLLLSGEHFYQRALNASERTFSAAAPSPLTLLPKNERTSFFVKGNLPITERLSVSAAGVYTKRNPEYVLRVTNAAAASVTSVDVEQYSALGNLKYAVAEDWSAEITGSFARNSNLQSSYNLLNGVISAPSNPRYINTLSSAEFVSSGNIAEIGGGSIQAAFGAAFRHETLETTSIDANRQNTSAYMEVNVPFITGRNASPMPIIWSSLEHSAGSISAHSGTPFYQKLASFIRRLRASRFEARGANRLGRPLWRSFSEIAKC